MSLIDSPAAGRYSGAYNSVDVGVTEDGYEFTQESKEQTIELSDQWADSAIDAVYRGGNAFLQFVSLAYKAGSITPFWPWGALGVLMTQANPIGRLASAVASSMVLTVTANTPATAGGVGPNTLTASQAILAPNNPARLLFTSKLRTVPVRLRLLPYAGTPNTTFQWFTTT